jgi:predicted aconitase
MGRPSLETHCRNNKRASGQAATQGHPRLTCTISASASQLGALSAKLSASGGAVFAPACVQQPTGESAQVAVGMQER